LLKIPKESRSFSPNMKNLNQDEMENAKILRKYKMMRVEEQEREIQMSKISKMLEEEIQKNNC